MQTKFPKGKVVRERYIVEDLLGQGGFGAVYRVRDRRVRGNVFALKEVANPNAHQRNSFAFECDILRRLDHYALPRVYRVFEDTKHNAVYMLMDYIEGPNLERLRQRQAEQRFPVHQVMSMMSPILEAVMYLHTQQPPIIHRDIKPSNIIVPTSGEGAVLVDFGIAKEYDQDSTTTAIRHCSPGYGAPEQYVCGTSTQTDIYGLGATFYTLLTGEVPIDSLYRITCLSGKGTDPLTPAHMHTATVSPALSAVLQRAMAISCSDRFVTVEEFWNALKSCVGEEEEVMTEPMVEAVPLIECEEERNAELLWPLLVMPGIPELEDIPAPLDTPGEIVSVTPPPRPQVEHTEKHPVLLSALVMLVFIALGTGLLFGTRALPGMRSSSGLKPATRGQSIHMQATPTPVQRANEGEVKPALPSAPLAPTPTPVAVPTPTPQPSPPPTQQPSPVPTQPPPTQASPTPFPASYPTLVASYSGTIHNKPALVDATMSLVQIGQDQGSIHGYFSVGPGLIGSGNLSGTVSPDGGIQFTVPTSGSILPLFFYGQVHTDGSITGSYCSVQSGQCDYGGGGYGSWSVYPQSAGQQSSSQALVPPAKPEGAVDK